jgi:hypothetical protein
MPDLMPRLRFLRRPHQCNYCLGVDGVAFNVRPRIVARLFWVACKCGRRHYICTRFCARRVGSVTNGGGRRVVAECARGYFRRHKAEIAAQRRDGKGA